MPTIFWRDHSAGARGSIDTPCLRERYVADGRRAAEPLAKDENVLAVWMSGPFETPRISPESDLHMGVLVRRGRGSFYRHVIPAFSEVGRRLEMAFFTLESMRTILEKGFTGWNAVFDIDKLKDVVILFEREGILTEMRRGMGALKPARLFIGREIEELKGEWRLVEQHLHDGTFCESILASRRLMLHSLELMVVIWKDDTFSKVRELYSMATYCFPHYLVEEFELAESARGLRREEAQRLIEKTDDLVTRLFERTMA